MHPCFTWLVVAATCAAVVGCGSRTPLEGIDIYGTEDDGQDPSASASGDPPSTSSGTPTERCPPVVAPDPVPMLWYPLDGDLRNAGFFGGGLFDGYGEQTSFIAGVMGSAAEIVRPGGGVELTGTQTPFADVGPMTFVIWFEEPDATGLAIPVFGDLDGYGGLQFYRGLYDHSVFICWGGIYGNAPQGCGPFSLAAGGWHQLVLRRTSEISRAEVFLDAASVAAVGVGGFDLFAEADDMLLGDARVGEFDGNGRIRMDDVRLYDRALSEAELCQD
ncbi:MAG: LamG-like jellyroll fold domain-containing protein [Polyangiaceae bacterium]